MKKASNFLAAILIIIMLVPASSSVMARPRLADTLVQSNPSSCPSGGCAAGQRINFNATLAISSLYASGPNTQMCLYSLADGDSGVDANPWVDMTTFSITMPAGYNQGETDTLCTSNLPGANYSVLYSAYGSRSVGDDSLIFVFRINKTTNIDGALYLYNFQYDDGTSTWIDTY